MKTQLFVLLSFAAMTALADVTSNKVVMVSAEGNVNAPEVLATTAQLATNEVQVIAAAKAAQVAEQTAIDATNTVQDVVLAIIENNVVVYRSGITDSFGVVVSISDSCKCFISKVTPGIPDGDTTTHTLRYGLTEDIGALKPKIRAKDSLDAFSDVAPLDDASVSDPVMVQDSFVDADNNEYKYFYEVKVTVPTKGAYFFRVIVEADTPSGDGYTFDIKNGVSGGITANVVFGEHTLVYKGGLLVEVQ